MFSPITRFFTNQVNKKEKPSQTTQEKQPISQSDTKHLNTTVYIWEPGIHNDVGDIGHAAIQVGDNYRSIWPSGLPAFGPLKFFPVFAELSQTLDQDEASQWKGDLTQPSLSDDMQSYQRPPDRVFEMKNIDDELVGEKLHKLDEDLKSQKLGYQFFDNISFPYRMFHAVIHMDLDPYDLPPTDPEQIMPKLPKRQGLNCTGLVLECLNPGINGNGKAPLSTNRYFPWKMSPMRLADTLQDRSDIATEITEELRQIKRNL